MMQIDAMGAGPEMSIEPVTKQTHGRRGFRGLRVFKSGNVLYLASALALLWGIEMILEPIWAQQDVAGERFGCLGAINGYELALLGVTLLVALWAGVTEDAVWLVLLGGVFLVGSAVTLDVVAPGFGLPAVLIGAAGLLLAGLKFWTLYKLVLRKPNIQLFVGLAMVLLAAFLMPGILGMGAEHNKQAHAMEFDLTRWWYAGWLVTLAGCMIAWTAAVKIQANWAGVGDATRPRIRTELMNWLLGGTILAGCLLQQYATAWALHLKVWDGDVLGGLMVLALGMVELRRAYGKDVGVADGLLATIPLGLAAVILLSQGYTGKAAMSLGLLCYPPMLLALGAALLTVTAWRTRSLLMALGVLAYAGSALLAWGQPGKSLAMANPGWLLVAGAYVLLGCGAGVSVWKKLGGRIAD